MFTSEIYEARRARLQKTMGHGLLFFWGNNACGMNFADNEYTFRQDSTFLYLFGLDTPGLAAVIDVDADRTIIFGDELTIDDIVWTGPMPTLAEQALQVGVRETRPTADLAKVLDAARKAGQKIHFLPPYRAEHQLRLQALLGIAPAAQAAAASLDLIYTLADMRNHKAPEEIAEIEQAIDISVEMHRTAMRLVRPGATEREIASAITEIALRRGSGHSFPPIATTHGETLHNHGYIHRLEEGQLFLLDAGAENDMHYAGDLTSTIPVGARYTQRQREIYDINTATYHTIADSLRPGITYLECHLRAWTRIAEGLKQLGLMQGDPAEAAAAGAVALFMPHGLGHMMGLDVHDMESYGEVHVGYPRGAEKDMRFGFKSLRLGRTLEPGFVFTVEPGLYFIPELIDQWRAAGRFRDFIRYDRLEAWKDFGGIRNEEDYLITPDGHRHLGPHKPIDAEDVERAKNE
jgi:Xaa-Pro aminopeptidase